MENNQLKIIKTFGTVLIVWGVLTLCLAGLNCLVCAAYSNYSKLPSSFPFETFCGIILISCGIGLNKTKKWARVLTLFVVVPLFIIIIPYIQSKYLISLYSKGYMDPKVFIATMFEIIRILFGASLLYYFIRPKVKEQFK